jgi:hypothetical protein
MKLAWGNKVTPIFVSTFLDMCRGFQWFGDQPSYLMSCMAFEDAETFASNTQNAAGSGAVGLIQFMPSTAIGLGTTVENLALLSPQDQLYYVGQYFKPYASRIQTLSDMYMAILMPHYIGTPDDSVLFSGGVSYRQNSGLDANSDGKVTKAEATAKIQQKLIKGMGEGYALDVDYS